MTRMAAQLFGTLVLVGLVLNYIWWIVVGIGAWLVFRWLRWEWRRHCAELEVIEAQRAAIAARADQEHAWVMAGDPRGTFGERCWPPYENGEH